MACHDILEIPKITLSIENARQRVYFSLEHFRDNSSH